MKLLRTSGRKLFHFYIGMYGWEIVVNFIPGHLGFCLNHTWADHK